MHIYWFFLFVRIGVRLIVTGSGHQAGREEYEGDSDDEGEEGGGEGESRSEKPPKSATKKE